MFIPTNLFKYFHENLLNFITNEQLKYTVVDQNVRNFFYKEMFAFK